MHELGIVFHIIDTVEQVGRENGVTQVRCVTLDVGQVSGIEDPYLMDCWRWAAASASAVCVRTACRATACAGRCCAVWTKGSLLCGRC